MSLEQSTAVYSSGGSSLSCYKFPAHERTPPLEAQVTLKWEFLKGSQGSYDFPYCFICHQMSHKNWWQMICVISFDISCLHMFLASLPSEPGPIHLSCHHYAFTFSCYMASALRPLLIPSPKGLPFISLFSPSLLGALLSSWLLTNVFVQAPVNYVVFFFFLIKLLILH